MRIYNQSVTEGHTEQHVGSQIPPMTNDREDRHIVRSALQNHIITSRFIIQEMGMVTARPVSAYGASTSAATWPVLRFFLTVQD